MTTPRKDPKLRQLWLIAALPLILTACLNSPDQVIEPPKLLTEAEIKAAIDLRPATMPDLTPAFLGTSGTFETQTAPKFKVGQSVYLSQQVYRTNQTIPAAGQIVATGRVKVTLPAAPDHTQGETLKPLAFAQQFVIYDTCALNTLQLGAGQETVNLTKFTVSALRPDIALKPKTFGRGDQIVETQPSELRFVTSPIPDFARVLPYLAVDTKTEYEYQAQLVFADADVSIKGELRCANKWVTTIESADQYNLRINLDLKKGWNSVRVQSQPVLPKGKLDIQQLTVTGQAATFTPVP